MSQRTRTVLIVLAVVAMAVSVALEVAVPAHHGPGWTSYWYHHVPGFYGALGFVGCVLIVVVSKWIGKVWLQRPEDYYGEADPDAE